MVPRPDWSHQNVFAAEPMSAALARDFVGRHLAAHHLWHLVEDVCLVASELATNAVAHAQTPFAVDLSRTNELVRLAIQDGSDSLPIRCLPNVMAMGGRGMMIVESLSQEWGTSADARGLKSVWASFPSGPN
jgi:anti-sigma regulatory factor (Ser/Thr protein kinase)